MSNSVSSVVRFRVKERKWETKDIFTLVLEPEQNGEMIGFKAGQWVYLHLLNLDGSTWARAPFSIATAPEEAAGGLELGIKIKGEFTNKASQLGPDDVVGLQGPFGVFIVPENAKRLVMFAGGIGITPLRSMIRSLYLRRAAVPVTLFYSVKAAEDGAYFEELAKMAKEWPDLHPVFTLTDDVPRTWAHEQGRITAEMIKKYCPDLVQADFMLCGPSGFMAGIEQLLAGLGVDVKQKLKHEKFG